MYIFSFAAKDCQHTQARNANNIQRNLAHCPPIQSKPKVKKTAKHSKPKLKSPNLNMGMYFLIPFFSSSRIEEQEIGLGDNLPTN